VIHSSLEHAAAGLIISALSVEEELQPLQIAGTLARLMFHPVSRAACTRTVGRSSSPHEVIRG